MVKSRLGAYDGRGNFALRAAGDAAGAWEALGGARGAGLFVEAWVPFVRELAVIVVRGRDGACATYPAVQTIQRDSICHVVLAPAPGLPGGVAAEAGRVAAAAVAAVGGAGVFGVELFELPDGRVLLNEMAPRVHNSGHFSIEAAHCSQFENHVRAVLGLPLGSVALRVPAAAMVNVLGTGDGEAHTARTWALCAAALAQPSASVHWYAKAGAVKRGRKVGHVTVTGGGVGEVVAAVRALLRAAAGEGGGGGGEDAGDELARVGEAAPLVGVVMGSDSDLPCMSPAAALLREFGVPFELTLVSAHRTPARLCEYARRARGRGVRAIIAGAGGAAHLPGMLAAMTPLPVIGVPVPLKHLDGVDSLHSILQMPKGVPVATVAIGNSANAALLAVRILGAQMPELWDKMEAYQARMEREVLDKAARLESVGWEAYK
jgi:phosphoribosylaminoimidazole carboxylase